LIFRYLDTLDDDPGLAIAFFAAAATALIIGIAFHEFCHAFMADQLGDTLPARQGRVTLNPIAHLDPMGTLMMLFVGFGWGKPVQFNPFGLRVRPKTATLLVSLAGPLSNFVAAGLLGAPFKLGWVDLPGSSNSVFDEGYASDAYLGVFLSMAVTFNVILGIFNLIPIHPLDGFKVAVGILPDGISEEFARLAQYGPPILIVLIVLPMFFSSINPLADVMVPIASRAVELFVGTS